MSVQSLSFAFNQSILVSADGHINPADPCAVNRCNPSTGAVELELVKASDRVYAVALNSGGTRVAIANRSGLVTVYDSTRPSTLLDSFKFMRGKPLCVAYDPTADVVVAGSDNGQLAVRHSGQTICHNVTLTVLDSVAVNPATPTELAYATSQKLQWGIELISRQTGQPVGTVCNNVAQVRDIAYSHNGLALVGGGARGQGDDTQTQGRVQAVELPTQQPLWEMDEPVTVTSVSVSSDSQRVAVSFNQTVVIRSMTDGHELARYSFGSAVTDVAFDQTQPTRLAVGLMAGTIVIQTVP